MKIPSKLVNAALITGAVSLISGMSLASAQSADVTTPTTPQGQVQAQGQNHNRPMQRFKNMKQNMANRMQARPMEQAEVKAALASGNFETFKAAIIKNAPEGRTPRILEKINAGNFADFVKMTKLQDEARALHTKLGLDKLPHPGQMGGADAQ
ncbi:hypothetical protein KBD59_01690 [Candidatus Gracilibacteria bacterium]|nr:hypothetical protein [Candidatus Gracilibacteria bacterium]